MTDTRERARAFVRGEGCKCAPDHLTAFAESELELARFAPLGDNHHNAHKCPYCNPEREKELALARKQEREANCAAVCIHCSSVSNSSKYTGKAEKRNGKWVHQEVGFKAEDAFDCRAAAIHERTLAETGA